MELDEVIKLLEQREKRVGELRSRFAAVIQAEEELTRELAAVLSDAPPKPTARSRNRSTTREILDASYEILRSAESHELPMEVREIWSRLEARNVRVGGKKPHGNLSAKLGRDDRFRSEGRGGNGWSLAGSVATARPGSHKVVVARRLDLMFPTKDSSVDGDVTPERRPARYPPPA